MPIFHSSSIASVGSVIQEKYMKMQSRIVRALAAVICCLQLYGVDGQSCISACPGGQICVYGICTTLTNCKCAANVESLVDCTFPEHTGNDEEACVYVAECCWNKDKSKCHTPNTAAAATSCTNKVDPALRVDAGWSEITPNDCMCVGGCFDSSVENTFQCFKPTDLPAEKDLGEPCSGTDVCVDAQASCTGGVCACNAGYRAHNGVCAAEKDLGEPCSGTDVCVDPQASCTGGVCACNAGYRAHNGVCAPLVSVGDPCDAADVCKDLNAVCTNGTCQCTAVFNFRDGECKKICKKRNMDIVCVIDNSGTIDATELAEQKLFLVKLTESFTIDDFDTRVGLVKYRSASPVLNPLNKRNTHGEVDSDIRGLDADKGGTNAPAGLRKMAHLFSTQGGSHQKLGVFLTDGKSNLGSLSSAIAAIPPDVTMFSMGVDGCDELELEAIAGDPKRVYKTHDFDDMIKLIPQIREDMCPP